MKNRYQMISFMAGCGIWRYSMSFHLVWHLLSALMLHAEGETYLSNGKLHYSWNRFPQ